MNNIDESCFEYYKNLEKQGKGLYGQVSDAKLAKKYKFTYMVTIINNPQSDNWTYSRVYFKTNEDALNWIGVHEMTYTWCNGGVEYSEPCKIGWA